MTSGLSGKSGFKVGEFSVVIPIASGDITLIKRTLPSWIATGTDDLVTVIDDDSPPELAREIERVVDARGSSEKLRVVRAPRSHGWRFHQAYVRREGFRRARYDTIITGDIDLVVKRDLGRLTAGLMEADVGLVSCLRVLVPQNPALVLRSVSYVVKQKLIPPVFSGLYALWRPYWLETEDEGIRRLGNARSDDCARAGLGLLGEDTYLYVCMKRRYRCLHMNFFGGLSTTRLVEDLPREQFSWGRYMAATSVSPLVALGTSVAFLYPHLLAGFTYERRNPSHLADPFNGDIRL